MNVAVITDVLISRQNVSLYLTVITLHLSPVAKTPAPCRPNTLNLFHYSEKELEGTALFKVDKDNASASNRQFKVIRSV